MELSKEVGTKEFMFKFWIYTKDFCINFLLWCNLWTFPKSSNNFFIDKVFQNDVIIVHSCKSSRDVTQLTISPSSFCTWHNLQSSPPILIHKHSIKTKTINYLNYANEIVYFFISQFLYQVRYIIEFKNSFFCCLRIKRKIKKMLFHLHQIFQRI